MAFIVPTFNITCDIWTQGDYPANPARIVDQPCQMRAPSMTNAGLFASGVIFVNGLTLLFPAGTDVRDPYATPGNSSDVIECPTGSGIIWRPTFVGDIGKGFPNEHRYAIVAKTTAFPTPVPLP